MRYLVFVIVALMAVPAIAQSDCNNNGTDDAADIANGVSLDCNLNGIPDDCECVWDNGDQPADLEEVNGQISHIGGGAIGMGFDALRVADDLILPPGYLHRIMAFRGVMLTNSLAPARRARFEIFEDCNGQPADEPFFVSTNFEAFELGLRADLNYVVEYRFDLCEDNLWLVGGKGYWVALIGETDRVTDDLSSWAFTEPAGENLISKLAVTSEGEKVAFQEYEFGPWSPLCTSCPDCVNMVYKLDGYSCPIIHDNGRPDIGLATRGGIKSGPFTSALWRARDDFVIRMCEDRRICVIDAWVWANCDPMHGFLEIYSDDPCATKDGPPVVTEDALPPIYGPIHPTQVVDTGEELVIPGSSEPLRLYCMRFIEPSGWVLAAGRTYWISAGASLTGSFGTRSLFAFANRCPMPCDFMLNMPQVRRESAISTEWSNALPGERRDLAFRIAVEPLPNFRVPASTAEPDCRADMDLDGTYSVPDIFLFLADWFAGGCP
jgi:hypothetical protein